MPEARNSGCIGGVTHQTSQADPFSSTEATRPGHHHGHHRGRCGRPSEVAAPAQLVAVVAAHVGAGRRGGGPRGGRRRRRLPGAVGCCVYGRPLRQLAAVRELCHAEGVGAVGGRAATQQPPQRDPLLCHRYFNRGASSQAVTREDLEQKKILSSPKK